MDNDELEAGEAFTDAFGDKCQKQSISLPVPRLPFFDGCSPPKTDVFKMIGHQKKTIRMMFENHFRYSPVAHGCTGAIGRPESQFRRIEKMSHLRKKRWRWKKQVVLVMAQAKIGNMFVQLNLKLRFLHEICSSSTQRVTIYVIRLLRLVQWAEICVAHCCSRETWRGRARAPRNDRFLDSCLVPEEQKS